MSWSPTCRAWPARGLRHAGSRQRGASGCSISCRACRASFPVERFSKREDLARGPLSAGVPGNLAGWAELVARHGKKSLGDAFVPAIALARDGFPLVEFNVDETNEHAPALQSYPALAANSPATTLGGGDKAQAGRVLEAARPRQHARTRSAAEGPQLLYGGELGRTRSSRSSRRSAAT